MILSILQTKIKWKVKVIGHEISNYMEMKLSNNYVTASWDHLPTGGKLFSKRDQGRNFKEKFAKSTRQGMKGRKISMAM